jgi:hypothetical protein
MREIKMKAISSGPEGQRHVGQVLTVAKTVAAELVKGGYAEYTGKETATIAPIEKAIVKPPEEETIQAPENAATEENAEAAISSEEVEAPQKSKGKGKGGKK